MDAPTEWTYGGKLDWSSADSLKLAPEGMVIRCIVETLKEKAAAANYTLPEILSADWNPLNVPYDVATAIQTAVTALVPLFCNHTDNAGDWSGLSDASAVAPVWTEAAILAALGTESRLVPARLGLSREWVFQQYQILNMLRWIKKQLYFLKTYTRGWAVRFDLLSESDIINAWNSSSWAAFGSGATAQSGYDGGQSRCLRVKSTLSINYTYENQIQIDCYLKEVFPGGSSYFDGSEISVTTDGVFSKIISGQNISCTGWTSVSEIGNIDTIPSNYYRSPLGVSGYGWLFNSATGYNYAVLKFDGANGFKFRDW